MTHQLILEYSFYRRPELIEIFKIMLSKKHYHFDEVVRPKVVTSINNQALADIFVREAALSFAFQLENTD